MSVNNRTGRFIVLWILSSLLALLILALASSVSFWGVIIGVPVIGVLIGLIQMTLLRRGLNWQPQVWVVVTALGFVSAVMAAVVVLAWVLPALEYHSNNVDRLLLFLIPLLVYRLILGAAQSFMLSLDIQHAQIWLLANVGGAAFAALVLTAGMTDPAALLDVLRLDIVLALIVPAALNAGTLVWLRQHESIPDADATETRLSYLHS